MFQFTHPGGVRLSFAGKPDISFSVSIHAPGRGATQDRKDYNIKSIRFQFTHPGGVRLRFFYSFCSSY